ncbi:sugar phosphate isomerase/epimerase family protein [Pseudoflavonifractor phocaeensis]|uniref:sugar phosphate isomerase/epimerase family protein n=1 Tax=Pseudoflavonifractor phocaeensis TaxID=1870988 RepID=UPI001F271989|nr:sugar phosphate isomerase/epimerase family protein [Pseudoflavonifractor phocaeensis]MCF2595618.1 sugar phosphate isomerase/epimerase [Pseudoflavonifractor phocaeensis]
MSSIKHLKRAQIACSNYHYIKYSLPYFLNSMVNLDQHLIEFYAASPHLSVEDATYNSVKVLKRELDAREIKVCCLTQEQCVYPINIACEDDAIRERSTQTFMKTIEFAAQLQAPYAQIVCGRGYFDNPEEDAWKRSAESLSRIVDKASRYGVTMVIEAASYNTTNVVYDSHRMRRMIDEIGSPNLKGMLDTCAVAMAGEDIREDLALLGQDMVHLHFADGTPLGHFIPGEGKLPLIDYLTALDEVRYTGAIPFEIYNRLYDFEPEGTMKKCLEFMYQVIPE